MVQKIKTIMNDHVTASLQVVPYIILHISNASESLFITIPAHDHLKSMFEEFCGSFNDNIDFQTTIDWFNNEVKIKL